MAPPKHPRTEVVRFFSFSDFQLFCQLFYTNRQTRSSYIQSPVLSHYVTAYENESSFLLCPDWMRSYTALKVVNVSQERQQSTLAQSPSMVGTDSNTSTAPIVPEKQNMVWVVFEFHE